MTRIHVVTTAKSAQKAVQDLLVSNGIIGLSCKSGAYSRVSLIVASTGTGDVYVFDVKKGRDVIFDGGMSRILQSADVLKVAYSVILESEGLPARTVDLHCLCDKIVPERQRYFSKDWMKILREDRDAWMRRPLSKEMVQTLVTEVTPLVPHLYPRLLRAIRPEHISWFERMNDEHRVSKSNSRVVETARRARAKQEQNETAKCQPLLSLTQRQKILLADTTPLIRFCTTGL